MTEYIRCKIGRSITNRAIKIMQQVLVQSLEGKFNLPDKVATTTPAKWGTTLTKQPKEAPLNAETCQLSSRYQQTTTFCMGLKTRYRKSNLRTITTIDTTNKNPLRSYSIYYEVCIINPQLRNFTKHYQHMGQKRQKMCGPSLEDMSLNVLWTRMTKRACLAHKFSWMTPQLWLTDLCRKSLPNWLPKRNYTQLCPVYSLCTD